MKDKRNTETILKALNNKDNFFSEKIEKLFLGEDLTFEEKSFLLSCAIVFLKEYDLDKRRKGLLEFAYLIILKYSIKYNDYRPLNDLAYNLGFYPISKTIFSKFDSDNKSIKDIIHESMINKFKKDGTFDVFYYQTFEQAKIRNLILKSNEKNISLVAPTSFGKSSLIVEILKNYKFEKAAIIVPTKSLLRQTYRLIKKEFSEIKIVLHDDMYNDEPRMIGVLTQERAYRLLMRNDLIFDILFIDEAHNIFNKDDRNILLSRVIRSNKIKNRDSKVIYLSPLIDDSNNLKIDFKEKVSNEIKEYKINFNLKEPDYFFFENDSKKKYIYNRFNDVFYEVEDLNSFEFDEYIVANSKTKNLIYINTPRKIEKFTKNFKNKVEYINQSSIDYIEEILKKYIHENYIGIEYLKHGIIYLHGKLPNILKEYLEYKFNQIPEIRFLVANSVVFEGMNFPLDSLFILNTYYLSKSKLMNLIGRVNRLNNVFKIENEDLSLLMPAVHFVDNEQFQDPRANMKNKLSNELRNTTFQDKVKNPILINYDSSLVSENVNEELIDKKQREDFIFSEIDNTEINIIKKYLVQRNIDKFYTNLDIAASGIYYSIKNEVDENFENLDVIEKIFLIFIKNIEWIDIEEREVRRLHEEKARNFYKSYISHSHWKTMKENIDYFVDKFIKRKESEKIPILFIGKEFGDFILKTDYHPKGNNKVYINLNDYNKLELINIAIVKVKMENDFISYKVSSFLMFLKDVNLIDDEEFNLFIYGTNDTKKIDLLKIGLNVGLIKSLEEEGLLDSLTVDEYGNIITDDILKEHIKKFDDFKKFQIERFL